MHSRRAFTLIELMVVIAIIAILMSLLSGAIQRSRVAGWQAACSSNLRAVGTAIVMYGTDHEGDFPRSAHSDERESWIYTLAPYLQKIDEVRICPADPRADERRRAKGTSYVLNEYIAVPLTDPFGRVKESYTKRTNLTSPESTMIVFIGADALDVGVTSDHTHSRNWKSWEQVLSDIQPDRFRVGTAAKNHTEGTANYLFADGHVENRTALWLKTEIDAGRNPAIPPK